MNAFAHAMSEGTNPMTEPAADMKVTDPPNDLIYFRQSELDSLRQQLADAQSQLHTCPTCGENCKECECVRRQLEAVTAERDELRRERRSMSARKLHEIFCESLGVASNWDTDSSVNKEAWKDVAVAVHVHYAPSTEGN